MILNGKRIHKQREQDKEYYNQFFKFSKFGQELVEAKRKEAEHNEECSDRR